MYIIYTNMPNLNIKLTQRKIPEEDFLADIRSVAQRLSLATITMRQYSAKNGAKYNAATVGRRFGGWGEALRKAGLVVRFVGRVSDADLLENLKAVWIAFG